MTSTVLRAGLHAGGRQSAAQHGTDSRRCGKDSRVKGAAQRGLSLRVAARRAALGFALRSRWYGTRSLSRTLSLITARGPAAELRRVGCIHATFGGSPSGGQVGKGSTKLEHTTASRRQIPLRVSELRAYVRVDHDCTKATANSLILSNLMAERVGFGAEEPTP